MENLIYKKPTTEVVVLTYETNMLATNPAPSEGGGEGIGGGTDL